MAEKTQTVKPIRRRPGTMRSVIAAAVVLLFFSGLLLNAYSVIMQMLKLQMNVSDSMDRLFNSVSSAESASDGLTDIFDNAYLSRLEFLEYIREKEELEPEEILDLADRYLPGSDIFLVARRTGTVNGNRGELPSGEAIAAVCALLQNETGTRNYCSYGGDRYYSIRVTDTLSVIHRVSGYDYTQFMDNIYIPEEIIANNLKEGHNVSIAVRGGVIQYSPYDNSIGMPADDLIQVESLLPSLITSNDDDQYMMARIEGQTMIMLKRHIDRLGLDLYHGTSADAAVAAAGRIAMPVWIGMIITIVLYVAYSYFLRDDYVNRRMQTGITREILRYKNSAFLVLGVLFASAIAYYANTVVGLSDFIRSYSWALSNAEVAYYDALDCENDAEDDINWSSLQDAQMISRYLSEYPERRTDNDLSDISKIFRLNYIMMFDRTGTETVSNSVYVGYQISSDPEEQSYVFNPLKNGYPYVIRDAAVNELTSERDMCIGVTTKDATGHVDGFLQTVYRPVDLDYALSVTTVSNTFDNSVLSNTFKNFAVEKGEDGTIVYTPDHNFEGSPARENGFTDASLRSGFTGYLNVGDERYFAASKQVNELFLYTALPVTTIFLGRPAFVILAAVLILLTFLVLTWRLERTAIPHRSKEEIEEQGKASQRRKDGTVRLENGEEFRKNVFSEKRNRLILPKQWNAMSAEEKLGYWVERILLVFSLVFVLIIEFRDQLFGENNLISYTLGMSWDRGFNSFAASAAVIYGVMIIVGAYVLRSVLLLTGRLLNARGDTVCRLLSSCVKYIAAVAVVYLTLSFFGMDVRSLAASVGFLALIVSFGAKNLITDIVAGLFIIFEGEFQVGDIVEIGGYRGMVKEIGLRTTKIISWDKNVKIINNHNISTVVNMTMRNSFATVNFRVPLSEDIDRLEEVFKEEIRHLPSKYPKIIGEPFFSGVSSFSGSGMDCWISVEVEELDRGDMEKALAREVQEICARHEITLK